MSLAIFVRRMLFMLASSAGAIAMRDNIDMTVVCNRK